MTHLIDKDALVAEIERRIKEIEEIGTYLSPKGALTNLLCYIINTLEVKDMDLEKEIYEFIDKEELHLRLWDVDRIAKYFFELGLKAQKGE